MTSLAYERVCVLFNMAAAQSTLAAQQLLDTEDSLKLAAKLLQQAAGIFEHLKATVPTAVHQEPTPDLTADTLAALSVLMLAQAQEVIAYKCIRDEMKDSMVAKVCAQCEELYTDALRGLHKQHQMWERDWISTVSESLSGRASVDRAAVLLTERARTAGNGEADGVPRTDAAVPGARVPRESDGRGADRAPAGTCRPALALGRRPSAEPSPCR